MLRGVMMYWLKSTTTYSDVFDIYNLFVVNPANAEAVQELKVDVSDHKPIFATFRCDIDEDRPIYGDLANLKIKQ